MIGMKCVYVMNAGFWVPVHVYGSVEFNPPMMNVIFTRDIHISPHSSSNMSNIVYLTSALSWFECHILTTRNRACKSPRAATAVGLEPVFVPDVLY